MQITARHASRVLEEQAGVGRQQSRRVLLAGLAGAGTPTGGSLLYDADRVAALAAVPSVDESRLLARSPGGVFVARLGRGREVTAETPWDVAATTLRRQPDLGLPIWQQVRAHLTAHGRLPFVATVCGWPVFLADLVAMGHASPGGLELDLEDAGEWRRLLEGRRLRTSPGPPWLLLGHQPYLGRAGAARERGESVGAGRSTMWSRWG